jgi:hypothetical protein
MVGGQVKLGSPNRRVAVVVSGRVWVRGVARWESFWVRVRRNGFGGLSVWFMGNMAVMMEARRRARRAARHTERLAALAALEEPAWREWADMKDLAAFMAARERADAVDARLAKREQALRERAAQQRGAQRVVCGRALRAMRDRGKSVREIALMAGVAETTARKLIREADAAPDGDGPGSPLPKAGVPPPGRTL